MKKHDVNYKRNLKISDISSIKIGGYADVVAYPKTEEELISTLDFLVREKVPYKLVGKMTNILASDEGFRGVIVSTKLSSKIEFSGCVAYASSGALVNSLLFSAAKENLGGLEELFGIPGTLGGLIHNNGGAGSFDISRAVLYARVYSPEQRKILILDNSDLKLGYRSSIFYEKNYVALSLAIAFVPRKYSEVMQKIKLAVDKRRETQPLAFPSLGSVFKRENGNAVSRLIDEAGLKGFKIGGAQISKKHAGFIINRGKATAHDVLALIEFIKRELYKKYGFEPKEEIEFLG